MVGIAQRVIYENGAEYEGLPMYVFSESQRGTLFRARATGLSTTGIWCS